MKHKYKIANSRWDWKTSEVSLLQIPFPKLNLYELLGNPTTQLIEPPGSFPKCKIETRYGDVILQIPSALMFCRSLFILVSIVRLGIAFLVIYTKNQNIRKRTTIQHTFTKNKINKI